MEENQTATYFLCSRLFTYDIMKNFNCNISLWFFKSKFRSYIGKHFYTPVSRPAVLCDWAGVHTGFRTITLVLYIGSLPNLVTWFPCGRGRTLFILGSLGQRSRLLLLWIEFLTTGLFPHDNFNSVYWIFTKLGHMIPLWKGKNLIYVGVKGQGHHYYK
jgi:hypothetical protein